MDNRELEHPEAPSSHASLMNREWDDIAARNPHYGILSWPDFQDPANIDEERFYASGAVQADTFLAAIGLRETRGQTMLEIGCGVGRMTHRFAERFETVYALDISQRMIDRARARWGHLRNVRFLKGTGQDLAGVEDASVPFVFSFLVLQHLTDEEIVFRYIRECARVLRPAGVAFLQFGTAPVGPVREFGMPALWRVGRGVAACLPVRLADALRGMKQRLGWGGGLPACWWNEGLHQAAVAPCPDLTEDITRKTVWRGCRVPVGRVYETCAGSGLAVRSLDGVGTQYTFLTAVKQG